MMVEIAFDSEADAAYINLGAESGVAAVRQLVAMEKPGVYEIIFDLDESDKLLGIEVIGATAALGPALLSDRSSR